MTISFPPAVLLVSSRQPAAERVGGIWDELWTDAGLVTCLWKGKDLHCIFVAAQGLPSVCCCTDSFDSQHSGTSAVLSFTYDHNYFIRVKTYSLGSVWMLWLCGLAPNSRYLLKAVQCSIYLALSGLPRFHVFCSCIGLMSMPASLQAPQAPRSVSTGSAVFLVASSPALLRQHHHDARLWLHSRNR